MSRNPRVKGDFISKIYLHSFPVDLFFSRRSQDIGGKKVMGD